MKRRAFITLVGGMAAWLLAPHDAIAQPSDPIRRIALLSGFAATDPEAQARVAALHQGLKELGWLEGRNLSIDFRWGERDQMQLAGRPHRPVDRLDGGGNRGHPARGDAKDCADHEKE